jgi:hypothetical protein
MRPRTRRILLQAAIADAIVSAAAAIFLPAAAWAAQMPATGTIDVCDGLSLNIRSIDRLHPGEPVNCCDTRLSTGCRTYTTGASSLGNFNNIISSVRVR